MASSKGNPSASAKVHNGLLPTPPMPDALSSCSPWPTGLRALRRSTARTSNHHDAHARRARRHPHPSPRSTTQPPRRATRTQLTNDDEPPCDSAAGGEGGPGTRYPRGAPSRRDRPRARGPRSWGPSLSLLGREPRGRPRRTCRPMAYKTACQRRIQRCDLEFCDKS